MIHENAKGDTNDEINFITNISNNDIIKKLIAIFRAINDPEIPINIYDLGLIYEVSLINNELRIKMTLTAVGCPYWNQIFDEMKKNIINALGNILNINNVNIELIIDPPWTPIRMTKYGREMYKTLYGFDPAEQWLKEKNEFEKEQEEI